jgi:hypothetical protein
MKFACVIALSLLAGTGAVSAHHSFAAEYEGDKPVTITGTVAKIDWQNPHIYFDVDVKDAKGAVTQWKVEGYPPNMLVRQGWKKDATMKVGDTVKVFGWRARANPTQAAGRDVTFADGKKLNCGPPAGTGGQ